MRLKHVTLTGIDQRTNLVALQELQREYPFAEFGVLISTNWEKNGNRYFNPNRLNALRGRKLNLSCHACGVVARHALNNDWKPLMELTHDMLHMFNRCQLNVSCYVPTKNTQDIEVIPALCEVIIQQRDANNLAVYNAIKNKVGISILLDASGGHGIDTKIVPLGLEGVKIGYAGGINPDNVAEKLSTLLDSELTNSFWIDMESGVRTDDWFDLDKAHKVLETCKQIMQ